MSLDPAALGGLLPAAAPSRCFSKAAGAAATPGRPPRRALGRSSGPGAPPVRRPDPCSRDRASRRARREVLLHWILLVLGLGAIFALGKLI